MRRTDGKEKTYTPLSCVRCEIIFTPVSGRQLACHDCKKLVQKEKPKRVLSDEKKAEYAENNRLRYLNASPEEILFRKERARKYHKNSISKLTENQKLEKKLKQREIMKERYRQGKNKIYKPSREYFRERLKIPKHCLDHRMQNGIRLDLKKRDFSKEGKSWRKFVDYTILQLKEHLESLFIDGMSWENMHLWHIDHVHPKSKFEYSSPYDEGFQKCWSLNNLQPLWAEDNLRKGSKILE